MHHAEDFVLIGTGLAPLICAEILQQEGHKVLVLNPDQDFFREENELALDPLQSINGQLPLIQKVKESLPKSLIDNLNPFYPGTLETWLPQAKPSKEFHDFQAPHIRARSRLWISRNTNPQLESLYIEASDSGMAPVYLEGLIAETKFPGFSISMNPTTQIDTKAVLIPRICDFDVTKYNNAVLEYIRERLGPENILSKVTHLELSNEQIRFYYDGKLRHLTPNQQVVTFWSPKLAPWIIKIDDKKLKPKNTPKKVTLWEDWSIVSRDTLDPETIGCFENLIVWAEVSGSPSKESPFHELHILRKGKSFDLNSLSSQEIGSHYATNEAFQSIHELLIDFLGWSNFSVRKISPKLLLEWDHIQLEKCSPHVSFVSGSEGFIGDVVNQSRFICEQLLNQNNGPSNEHP